MMALGLAIYVGRLSAQTGAQSPRSAAAEPRTRIALLNLHYVIKNYKKYVTFQEEIKRSIQPLQQRDQAKRAELEALSKEAQSPTLAPDRRDSIEKKAKDLQREL